MEEQNKQPNIKFFRFNSEGHYKAMKNKLDNLMGLPKGKTIHSIPPADQAQKDENGNFLLALPRWIYRRQEKLDKDNRPEATKRFHPVFNEKGEKIGETEEQLEDVTFDEIDRNEYFKTRKTTTES